MGAKGKVVDEYDVSSLNVSWHSVRLEKVALFENVLQSHTSCDVNGRNVIPDVSAFRTGNCQYYVLLALLRLN